MAKMQDRIIARASEDGEFRARLVADPKATIQELTGTPIPDGIEVHVHEESATSFHLVLPSGGRLSDAEMAHMVGRGDDPPGSGGGGVVPTDTGR